MHGIYVFDEKLVTSLGRLDGLPCVVEGLLCLRGL